jgi:hypothetical protein
MADTEPLDDTESLVKPRTKKDRSPAQIAAFEKMKLAKHATIKTVDPTRKAVLAMVREKLNGPPKSAAPIESDSEEEVISAVEEPKKASSKAKKAPNVVEAVIKPAKASKIPPLPVEDSSSEEEIIVIKKRKKPKKKTIIIEESSDEEEETPQAVAPPKPPTRVERDTKTQQNKASRFKVTPADIKPVQSVCYFAD